LQACDLIGFLAKRAPKWLRPRRAFAHLFPHKSSKIYLRPLGVVGVIAPCNYPVVLTLTPMIEALMAGNTVILKPSEFALRTAEFLCSLFDKLRLEHPIVQPLPGGADAALALAGSGVDKISFTGGRVGAVAILTAAAKTLTPVVLELGGKDPMIVCEDADLE